MINSSVEKAYDAGATDFISKPLQWPILKNRVRYMLRSARAFDELRRSQAAVIAARGKSGGGEPGQDPKIPGQYEPRIAHPPERGNPVLDP